MTHRRHLLVCLAAAIGLPRVALSADGDKLSYEGQQFDLRVRVAGAELALNGTGVRQVAWFKGYLAALYLPVRAATAAQVVGQTGPKRIHLRMLQDVPAVEFSKAVRKGIARNIPAGGSAPFNERLERFVKLIDGLDKVRAKDVVNLDFEPGRGLVMYVNATLRGEPIPGDDFYAALLRSFVGDVPYDEKMRAGLLGKPA
jgi:Chalcone isomerase-like